MNFAIDADHLERQRTWSTRTFGPGDRQGGVIDHISKELKEIAEAEADAVLGEWVDVIILAFDGAWRSGHEPQEVLDAIARKQARNEARTWPDWRTQSADRAIEHVAEGGRASMSEPTKQRAGDQVLPTGDEGIVDDQQLLIDDIEARRQVGISRYGQGHRPFNGRDTLQDLYEEQLDLLVYLRSIKRMHEASRPELVEVISKVMRENGFQQIAGDALGDHILTRLQGWIAANLIDPTKKEVTDV